MLKATKYEKKKMQKPYSKIFWPWLLCKLFRLFATKKICWWVVQKRNLLHCCPASRRSWVWILDLGLSEFECSHFGSLGTFSHRTKNITAMLIGLSIYSLDMSLCLWLFVLCLCVALQWIGNLSMLFPDSRPMTARDKHHHPVNLQG